MITLAERFIAALDDMAVPERDLVEPALAAVNAEASVLPLRRRMRSKRVTTMAAALLLALVATVAISPMREAVADWFGIGATQVVFDPTDDLSSLSQTSVAALQGRTVDSALNPLPGFEAPAAVFDLEDVRGRTYVWSVRENRPALGDTDIGVMLTGRSVDGAQATKRLVTEGVPEPVLIAVDTGADLNGLWIADAHEFTAGGTDRPALSSSVLLWTSGTTQFRLEANLDLEAMTSLAASVDLGTDLLPPG